MVAYRFNDADIIAALSRSSMPSATIVRGAGCAIPENTAVNAAISKTDVTKGAIGLALPARSARLPALGGTDGVP